MAVKKLYCNYEGSKGCDRCVVSALSKRVCPDQFAVGRDMPCPNPNYPCPVYAKCKLEEQGL